MSDSSLPDTNALGITIGLDCIVGCHTQFTNHPALTINALGNDNRPTCSIQCYFVDDRQEGLVYEFNDKESNHNSKTKYEMITIRKKENNTNIFRFSCRKGIAYTPC